MSDMEIERATMAPRRWVRRCAAWAKKSRDNLHPKLSPRKTRIIQGPLDGINESTRDVETFLVPGGRYLVVNSPRGMGIWDLGYTSNADCKLIASVGWNNMYTCLVNATSNGMGLIIVATSRHGHCSVYEIYPLESETPHLTRIAHLEFPYPDDPLVLPIPNKVVYCELCADKIIFRVWDYRLNHSISFSADFDVRKFRYNLQAIATETMIIVLCEEAIYVWEIPPLLAPQPVCFFDHDPTPISPLQRVPFPNDLVRKSVLIRWFIMSRWHSGSSPSLLYFDALCSDLSLYGFEIVIKPDSSDLSLRVINTTLQLPPHNFSISKYRECGGNGFCENLIVSVVDLPQFPIYFRPISSHPNDMSAQGSKVSNMNLFTQALPITEYSSLMFSDNSLCTSRGDVNVLNQYLQIFDISAHMTFSKSAQLTFTTIGSDLQIKICMFLHPFDILSLRKTSKTFLVLTSQRIIWIDAIHRLCLDNALFLPSFPVHDMSVMEMERAATAPSRWIGRCAKRPKNNLRPKLSPMTTRIIQGPLDGIDESTRDVEIFLVPGGRYLVANSPRGMSVWDLGYASNADCKLVASVEWDSIYTCLVNPTSDGMGLIIIAICRHKHCSVYEIYPLESGSPHLTPISHNSYLESSYARDPQVISMPNKVVYCELCADRIIFRVWDYRLNHSMSFSTDFDVQKFDYKLKAIATETTIIILCEEVILIWGIPPLLAPQPVGHFNHDPIPIPLLRRVPFPDDIVRKHGSARWITMSSWYSGCSSSSLYFDALCNNLSLYGFEIVIKPESSDVSLRVINSSSLLFNDLNNVAFNTGGNGICENALVSATDSAIYFRSIPLGPNAVSARGYKVPNKIIVLLSTASGRQHSLGSTSGRFVYPDLEDKIIVVHDFI